MNIKKILSSVISDRLRLMLSIPRMMFIRNSNKNIYRRIGKHTMLIPPLSLFPEFMELDDYTRLQSDTRVISSGGIVKIGKYTSIAASCTFVPGSHIPTVGLPQFLSLTHINDTAAGIILEEDVWAGTRCTFLAKSHVHRGCVIGACSLINKEIPPYAVAVGSPARIIATRFNKEQILQHERILYPPEERLSEAYLDELFATIYKDLPSIGVSEMSEEDKRNLQTAREKYEMKTYEHLS